LVRSQWWKYDLSLAGKSLAPIPENASTDFNLSVVNIEGNSFGAENKSPYVIPPGVQRDQDNTTVNNRSLNEQSLQICVEDLEDNDARGVFKKVGLDLINYGRLKMYFHAESYAGDILKDGDVTAFVRLGTDQDENYYEIEVPLIITPSGVTKPDAQGNPRLIWPEENEISISINELLGLKSERNKNKDTQQNDLDKRYFGKSNDGKYNLYVKGNPDISTLLMMMIGVRNPKVEGEGSSPKSVCIWANEMRVTDFDTRKGWAANARMSAKLADVATVNASTRYTSIGFGSLQQNIQQRTREETIQYDVSASVNLDKFLLPQKTGLKVPMFIGMERSRSTPQFDPLDPDTPLEASLESLNNEADRARYRKLVEDRRDSRSINFTNVHKEKVNPEAKSHIYDVENLGFSYAFSESESSNVNTAQLIQRSISGGVAYTYSPKGFTFEPFAKGESFSSPYLKLIKDINFSPLPTNISVRADLNRSFRKTQYYDDDLNATDTALLNYEKLFTFGRNYGLRWAPFKSLSMDYSAKANAIIDEPTANIDGEINTGLEKEYIWGRIKDLGRMKNFTQDMSATYRLPLDKLPFTDWVSADVKYGVGYNWLAGARNQLDANGKFFGHTIQNSRDRGANGKVDMNKLYDKVTFLKEANAQKRDDDNKSVATGVLKFLMSVKNFNVSYSVRESTTLPGFVMSPFLMGMGVDSSRNAPGWDFILGSQDPKMRFRAAENDWLTKSSELTTPFQQNVTTDFSIKSSVEPFKDLKIQLDAVRSNSGAFQEIFKYDTTSLGYASLTPSRSGSYSISFLAIKTSFIKDKRDHSNPVFDQFEENIGIIKRRQDGANSNGGEYRKNSQDVMIPAFLAAYSGKDAGSANLTPFPKIPIPNWRMDYTGLSKIPAIAKIFSSFTISHGYRSMYNVNNYTNSLRYSQGISLDNNVLNYPQASELDELDTTYVSVFTINQVSIIEQFAPLIGLNLRTKNGLSFRFDYKKDRNITLEMSNSQVFEARNNDFTFDFGLTKSDFKLPMKIRGRVVGLENDITFRMAVTLRDGVTIQRAIGGENKPTNGNTSFNFRPALTYKINNQMDLTAYFDRSVNEPKVSSSFNTSSTAFGFQLKFGLAQ
jgi:cell surface protein SprA